MIEIQAADVLLRFSALSGLENAGAYQTLCSDAAAELGAAERESCGEEGRSALTAAAGALALYRFALARAGTGTESFSAGDVRVSAGAGDAGAARTLWKNAEAAAAPYLADPGRFLFGRIPG